jgi:hypothetical protein
VKNYLLYALACILLTGAVSACQKSDKPDNGTDTTIEPRLVKTIKMNTGTYTSTMTFTYDSQERPTKLVTVDSDEETSTVSLAWGDNAVTMTIHEVDPHYESEDVYVCSMKDGRVEKWTWTESDGEPVEGESVTTATYNADGYMTRTEHEYTYSDYDHGYTQTLVWADNNLQSYHGAYTDDYDSDETDLDFQYGSVANNPLCNIDLNGIVLYLDREVDLSMFFRMTGKSSDKMISRSSSDEQFVNHSYTTDSEGFVTKITVSGATSGTIDVTYQ